MQPAVRSSDVGSRKLNDISSEAEESNRFSMDDFNSVLTAIVVVDHQNRVLRINPAAKVLLGHGEQFSATDMTCHELICGTGKPCEDCLLQSPPGGPKSHAIRSNSGRELFIREERLCFTDVDVLVLFDVTREITALRNLDLVRKELKAKTVLLERRRHVAADEKRRIEQMFDQLPDAFVQVDDEYGILYKNKSVAKILPHESPETCYALLGKEAPCKECPLQREATPGGSRKVIHRIAGQCFTEHVIQSSGDGPPLLLFSDTTRQIELIEKIREQQETITRKNDILSNLVNLQTRMHKAVVSDDFLNYFLDMFLPLCGAEKAIMIIDDIRPGSVRFVVHRGVDESRVTPVVRNYLSREVQQMDARRVAPEFLPWEETCQMELIGGNGRKVGIIIFPETGKTAKVEFVQLFSEPFGAFIHNRMLLRQLEESANTDPLTGLYNRRYIEEALVAEKKKSDRFDVPYSVIVVDVNRLKQANDSYGHDTGDRLLLFVGERLKAEIRETDTLARIGGDEFLIVLADTHEAGAHVLVERFSRKVFNNTTIEVGKDDTFPVTVSMGVAGSDQMCHDDLLRTADERMYEAKKEYYQTHKKYR